MATTERVRDGFQNVVLPVIAGRSKGTAFYIGASVVATCYHVLGDSKKFTVGSEEHTRESVLFEDSKLDLILIRTKVKSGSWLLPNRHSFIGKQYLFISNVDGVIETGLITSDGYREGNRGLEMKFSDGQIVPGFSGSPVISLDDYRFIGILRLTRSRTGAYGGYAIPPDRVIELRQSLTLDRDDHKVDLFWRDAIAAPTGRAMVDLTTSPLRHRPFFGHRHHLSRLLGETKPNWVVFVAGAPGMGKTALATHWLYQVNSGLLDRRAYLDIGMFPGGNFPVLRSISAQLDVVLPEDPFGARSREETAALVRWKVSQLLASAAVVIDGAGALHGPPEVDLLELFKAGAFSSAATMICADLPESWLGSSANVAPTVHLRELDVDGASALISHLLPRLADDICHQFAALLDAHHRSPALLNTFISPHLQDNVDVYELAQKYSDSIEAEIGFHIERFAQNLSHDERHVVAVHVLDLVGNNLTVTLAQMMTAVKISPEQCGFETFPVSLHLLLMNNLFEGHVLDEISRRATSGELYSSSVLMRIIEALPSSSQEPVFDGLRSSLAHDVLIESRNDALGAIEIPIPGSDSNELVRWVGAIRRAGSSSESTAALPGLDPREVVSTISSLELIRRELLELDSRHDFPFDGELLRRRLLEAIPAASRESHIYYELLSDSCQSSTTLGYHNGLSANLRFLRTVTKQESRVASLRLRALIQGILSRDSAAMIDASTFHASLLELMEQGLGLSEAYVLAGEFLRSCSLASVEHSAYQETLEWSIARAVTFELIRENPGTTTRLIAVISLTLDMAGRMAELQAFLDVAIPGMEAYQGLLKALARSGDNRPILCLARQSRRLSRVLRPTRFADANKSEKKAIDVLNWVARNAPSAGAWLTLLKSVQSQADRSLDGFYWETLSSSHEVDSLKKLENAYRDWAHGRPVSARSVEIEYLLTRAAWIREGSLLRMAAAQDGNWVKRPLMTKLNTLERYYNARLKRLRAISREVGTTETGIVFEASLESQFQTSKAVLTRQPVETSRVAEILESGLRSTKHSIRIRLEIARYLRQRRMLPEALEAFSNLAPVAGGDAATLRAFRIDWAETLVQYAASGSPDPVGMCQMALDLLANSEEAIADAAMLSMRARLELDGGALPTGAQALRDFFADGNYAFQAANNAVLLKGIGESFADDPLGAMVRRVASDATNPRLLAGFGSYLVRSFALDSSSGLKTLEAALNCLDGARIMSAGQWSTPLLNFHTGLALTLAVRHEQTASPLGWARRMGFNYESDATMGHAKLQSAADLSVGEFRQVIIDYMRDQTLVTPAFSD